MESAVRKPPGQQLALKLEEEVEDDRKQVSCHSTILRPKILLRRRCVVNARLDRRLQLLRRPERDLLACGDLDSLARSGVPAHAR